MGSPFTSPRMGPNKKNPRQSTGGENNEPWDCTVLFAKDNYLNVLFNCRDSSRLRLGFWLSHHIAVPCHTGRSLSVDLCRPRHRVSSEAQHPSATDGWAINIDGLGAASGFSLALRQHKLQLLRIGASARPHVSPSTYVRRLTCAKE